LATLVQVVTTIDGRDAAQAIADALVGERLAACVQVSGPLSSTYRWQGEIQHAAEWVCTAKTTRDRAPALLLRLRALHSYDQPEILVTPVADADPGYAAWVAAEVATGSGA
jgi:periplasmic divalent cation tolerance protein